MHLHILCMLLRTSIPTIPDNCRACLPYWAVDSLTVGIPSMDDFWVWMFESIHSMYNMYVVDGQICGKWE